MSYTITLTNGSTFATIPDGTINTSSSMTLVGKNYAGYGQFANDNIIRLLQNGANTTAPGAPIQGQLWYDQTTGTMKMYTGSIFKIISGATASSTAPAVSSVAGDLWYDTVNAQLNVYTGAAWILVGPAYTGNTGVSGAIVTTITDTNAVSHVAVEMYVSDAVVGIFSKDAEYTPVTPPAGGGWTGAKTVQPGLTMSGPISGVTPLFQGTAVAANTAVNVSGTVAVGNGGTGAITLASNNVLLGNGTSPLQAVAPGTSANVLTSNGTTWQSASLPVAVPSGAIAMWPTGTAPTGWLLANGAAVSRTTYATLFSLFGTTFGSGDGLTTFNIPNYTDRLPVGAGSTYAIASTGGNADAITVSHSHSATTTITDPGHYHLMGNGSEGSLNAFYGNDGDQGSGWRTANAGGAGVNGRTNAVAANVTASTTVSTTGSSGTGANMPPYLGIQFIIKT
jgi:microcystin-dependent protein